MTFDSSLEFYQIWSQFITSLISLQEDACKIITAFVFRKNYLKQSLKFPFFFHVIAEGKN